MISRIALACLLALFVASTSISNAAALQKRDHLTQQEVDLVKEAQILDKRIDVFIKATERRLMVINGSTAANAKQLKKDAERWGELPTGSRAELVADIARILDEAITNIDDVSARDERNPLIGKSLRKLAQAVNSIMAQLKPLRADEKSEAEVSSFELLNEDAQSILEAANRLPPEIEKKAKKNEKKKATDYAD
jgi:acyl-CoA reductase-like NAD-dependent aldehyde dehydrogenase